MMHPHHRPICCFLNSTNFFLGHLIIVVSAGNGVFNVAPPLMYLTEQSLIEKGIGCDLVCLTPPPLHIVPLFVYDKDPSGIPSLSPNLHLPLPPLSDRFVAFWKRGGFTFSFFSWCFIFRARTARLGFLLVSKLNQNKENCSFVEHQGF